MELQNTGDVITLTGFVALTEGLDMLGPRAVTAGGRRLVS
jgi:hypothetical protein